MKEYEQKKQKQGKWGKCLLLLVLHDNYTLPRTRRMGLGATGFD